MPDPREVCVRQHRARAQAHVVERGRAAHGPSSCRHFWTAQVHLGAAGGKLRQEPSLTCGLVVQRPGSGRRTERGLAIEYVLARTQGFVGVVFEYASATRRPVVSAKRRVVSTEVKGLREATMSQAVRKKDSSALLASSGPGGPSTVSSWKYGANQLLLQGDPEEVQHLGLESGMLCHSSIKPESALGLERTSRSSSSRTAPPVSSNFTFAR